MFNRRSRAEEDLSEPDLEPEEPGSASRPGAVVEKKGRPTPTRKQAEAAAAARAKVPRTRKEQAAAARSQRYGTAGGELPRDAGPVRHFVRDLVDSRLGFTQLLLPLVLLSVALSATPSAGAHAASGTLELGAVILAGLDTAFLRWRLVREVHRRFPEASLKGLTWYAVSRSIYPKFLRRGPGVPRPGVKIGQPLPEHYR